jgi:CRP-like cAMP-binding protein
MATAAATAAPTATTIEQLVALFLQRFVETHNTQRHVAALGRAHLAGGVSTLVRTAQLLAFLPKGSAGAFAQDELAAVLGVSRGHLNIMLADLSARGALKVTRRAIRVASYPALKRIAAGQVEERLPSDMPVGP